MTSLSVWSMAYLSSTLLICPKESVSNCMSLGQLHLSRINLFYLENKPEAKAQGLQLFRTRGGGTQY